MVVRPFERDDRARWERRRRRERDLGACGESRAAARRDGVGEDGFGAVLYEFFARDSLQDKTTKSQKSRILVSSLR